MATVSVLCNNTHTSHYNPPSINNEQLLQQLHSTNIENIILKQKITTLAALCEHHKSQYQQIKVQSQIKYHQQKDKHAIQINKLLEQIQSQNQNINRLQTHLIHAQQQSINRSILHNKQMKSLQYEIEHSTNDIAHLQQHNVSQMQEIFRLRNDLLHKDDHIGKLSTRLLAAYDQYIPSTSIYTKSPTVKIQSVRMSISNLSTKIPSPELSVSNLKYFNRSHDISPLPSLSNSNNYNHTHLRRSNNKKYMRRKSEYIKWSDTIKNSKPPPIRAHDDEYLDDIFSTLPNMPILHSLHANSFVMPITPFLLNDQRNSNTKSDRSNTYTDSEPSTAPTTPYIYQRNSNTKSDGESNVNVTPVTPRSTSSNSMHSANASIIYIKNSETPISTDVGIDEDMEQ